VSSYTEQSLVCLSEMLVETVDAVKLPETLMAEEVHLTASEQHGTAAIKNSVDFDWIWSITCLFHHQSLLNGIFRWCHNSYSW
jgi:hypothetical protein